MTDRDTITDQQAADIISRVENMELLSPPAGLTGRIMAAIPPQRQTAANRFWKFLSTPLTFSMRPVSAFSCALILAAVFGLGRFSAPPHADNDRNVHPPQQAVLDILESAQSNFLLGRGLLQENRMDVAIPLLQKAAALEPDNPEYAYWEGIGHWSAGNGEQERRSYLRGLNGSPDFIPLLINLGHTYLSEGNYTKALEVYRNVLELEPGHGVALYNCGLIFRKTEQTEKEMAAWREYLHEHRTGHQAFKALERLNSYGDYSYQAYQVGARRIIISPEALFDPNLSHRERRVELQQIAEILKKNRELKLEIVVFADRAPERARQRAHLIKQLLMSGGSEDIGGRIGLSWLGSPQPLAAPGQTTLELTEGLLLFSKNTTPQKKEV